MKAGSGAALILTAALAGLTRSASAQEAEPATVEALQERLRALEEEVTRLKGEPPSSARTDNGATAPIQDAGDTFRFDPALVPEEEEQDGLQLKLPGALELAIGGALRLRGELRDPADYRIPGTFGRPPGDEDDAGTDFVAMRTRLWFDFKVLEPLRVFIELQDSRLWGDRAIGADVAEIHLRQGFLEYVDLLGVKDFAVKAGRWEVPSLGDARLVSGLDWDNVARAWDGAMLTYAPKGFWFAGFAANLAEGAALTRPFTDRDENDDFWLSGLYASVRTIPDHELDAYLYWRHLSDRVFSSETSARPGDRKDFTLGVRAKGHLGPLGYSGELVYQWGDQAGDRISAYAGAVRTWADFKVTDGVSMGFVAEYAYASGDEDPTDGRTESFDPLLPFGHFYHGHMDLVLWRNIHAVQLGARVAPAKGLSLHLDTHHFWLAQREDAWFAPGRGPVRRDTSGDAGSYLGSELDLFVKYALWEHVFFMTGYSHFFSGDYVRDTGRAQGGETGDQDWWYAQVEVKF